MHRYANVVLEVDQALVPDWQSAAYNRLAKPLRLVQAKGGRVRIGRSGCWGRTLFANREELAGALLLGAADARAKAAGLDGTATGRYYADMAGFLREASQAVLSDRRLGRLWS